MFLIKIYSSIPNNSSNKTQLDSYIYFLAFYITGTLGFCWWWWMHFAIYTTRTALRGGGEDCPKFQKYPRIVSCLPACLRARTHSLRMYNFYLFVDFQFQQTNIIYTQHTALLLLEKAQYTTRSCVCIKPSHRI